MKEHIKTFKMIHLMCLHLMYDLINSLPKTRQFITFPIYGNSRRIHSQQNLSYHSAMDLSFILWKVHTVNSRVRVQIRHRRPSRVLTDDVSKSEKPCRGGMHWFKKILLCNPIRPATKPTQLFIPCHAKSQALSSEPLSGFRRGP